MSAKAPVTTSARRGVPVRRWRSVSAATGLVSLVAALLVGMPSATAASGPSVDLFQQFCNDGCGSDDWTNGALNSNNSAYKEGDVVPQRFVLKGIPAGATEVTVSFAWDTSKSDSALHLAYDHLASWDQSETLTLADAPLPGVAFTSSFPIPVGADVAASTWHQPVGVFSTGVVQAQNATLTGVTVVPGTDFTVGTSTSTVTFTMTPTPGQDKIGIAFGAHISSRLEWIGQATNPLSPFGASDKAPTAAGITGSPYHVAFAGATVTPATGPVIDVTASGRDNQLQANAVTPIVTLDVVKRLGVDQPGIVGPGDTITYDIVATNTGNTFGFISIHDQLSGAGAAISSIQSMVHVGGATTCTIATDGQSGLCDPIVVNGGGRSETVRVVVLVDRDAAGCQDVTLTNTANGGSDDGGNVVDVTIDLPTCPSLSLDKDLVGADDDGDDHDVPAGTDLAWTVVVSNTGERTADGVVVREAPGDGVTITGMAIGGTSCDADDAAPWECTVDVPGEGSVLIDVTGTWSPPAADQCGDYTRTNTASISDANGHPIGGDASDTVTLRGVVECDSDLSATKTVVIPDDGTVDVGTDDGVVVYEIVVENSGYAAATGVPVSDLVAANPDFSAISLHASQQDAEDGANALTDPASVDVPGATGVGNAKVDGTTSIWVRAVAELPAPGAACTPYALDNTALVDGAAVDARAVQVVPVPCLSDVEAAKAFVSLVEDDTHTDPLTTPQRTVTWTITLTNAGVVDEAVDLSDVLTGTAADLGYATLTTLSSPSGTCTPATGVCTDVVVPAGAVGDDAVVVDVVATIAPIPVGASCDPLDLGNGVTIDLGADEADEDDVVPTTNPTDLLTVDVVACDAQVSVTKDVLDTDGETWLPADEPGSGPAFVLPATAQFRVLVTNTGNVPLSGMDIVDVVDPGTEGERTLVLTASCLAGGFADLPDDEVSLFSGSLAPGDQATCFFTEEAQEGAHLDTVEVTGCWPVELCLEEQSPELQDRRWAMRVVAPAALPAALVVLPTTPLLTSATNSAHYVGSFPPPPPPPPVNSPSIDLVKQGSTTSSTVGGTVGYQYTVTNNGNVTLTDVALTDVVQAGSGNVTLALASGVTLAPGAVVTFTSTFDVTAADVGQVVNVATVVGNFGATQLTDTDDWVVDVSGAPSLSLVKTADEDVATFTAGFETVVTYTYLVTNIGDVPVSTLSLVDDKLGPISLDVTSLAPGASTLATATTVVTAQDAIDGAIVNVAVVNGLGPQGEPVQATDTEEVLVTQVLGEVIENPDPAPVPVPLPDLPETLPQVEVLPATGAESPRALALGLLFVAIGMLVLAGREERRYRTAT